MNLHFYAKNLTSTTQSKGQLWAKKIINIGKGILFAAFFLGFQPLASAQGNVEICDNNRDDDGDGFIDAADTDCKQVNTVFLCSDAMYMLRLNPSNNSETRIEQLTITNNTPNLTTLFKVNMVLNALAYHNGFLYAMENYGKRIFRIDAKGNMVDLGAVQNLPQPNTQWSGATIDRAGNYYIIEGTGSPNYRLYKIPLLPGGAYTATQVVGTGPNGAITVPNNPADIAIDENGTMYAACQAGGTATANSGLYTIDLKTGDAKKVGTLTFMGLSQGSLFAAADGNLYGYGTLNDPNFSQNKFYIWNKTTGSMTQIGTTGDAVGRSDGCSCPWRVAFKRRATGACIAPNSNICWEFSINNQFGATIPEVTMSDTLDARFSYNFDVTTVETQLSKDFGKDVSIQISSANGGVDNVVTITDLRLPEGNTPFLLCAEVRNNATFSPNEIVYEQAFLKNLPEFLGNIEPSDFPLTLDPIKDPSPLSISPAFSAKATNNGPFCVGETIELFATGGISYSWSSPDGFGSNKQNPTRTNAIKGMAGIYTVTITNTAGCVSTANTTVKVEDAAQFQAGVNQTQCDKVFTMAATDNLAGSGKWEIVSGSVDVEDVESPTSKVTLNSPTATLRWSVSTGKTCVVATDVTLNRVQPVVITTQPTSFEQCVGGKRQLGVAIYGGSNITYQWQISTDSVNWANVQDSTKATFTPQSTQAGKTYYRVLINTNNVSCAVAISEAATVIIKADPSVKVTAQSQTLCIGSSTQLKANIKGGVGCGLSWEKSENGGQSWQTLTGETKDTLAVSALSQTTRYRVQLNCSGNGCCE